MKEEEDVTHDSLIDTVERFLVHNGLLDLQHEKLHDVAILIGGTTYQPLHEDFAPDRSIVSDEHLAEVLNGPYSPASILIALGGENCATRLAIDRNDVLGFENE
jgi:hypothetical protein